MVKSPLTDVKKGKGSRGSSPKSLKSPLILIGGMGGGAAQAQRIAHGMADPKRINAKHKPSDYGEILEQAWAQVLPAFAPSEGSAGDLGKKMKKVMDRAWELVDEENISIAKAMSKAQRELGYSAPSAGPPPPVPGKAPSQGGAGHNGSIAGSPAAEEAMNRAQDYMDQGLNRSKALKKAWKEIGH